MKIALIGSKAFDSLEFHIQDSLHFLGHEVYHIDMNDVTPLPYRYNFWATKFFNRYNEYIFRKIAEKIITQSPDLVIATYRFIHPNCIKQIKETLPKIPVVQVNPDALTTFEYQQIFASPYDAYFTKDPYIVDFMKNKMRLNTFYLPEAFNQRVHKAPEKSKKQLEEELGIDLVAFGNMYPYRANVIKEIVKSGINVKLFGVPDRRFPQNEIMENFTNEFITGKKKSEIIYGSKIVFNNFHYAEIDSANVKFFEINGIGGFQICDYKPSLEDYTKIDSRKFTFKNIDEAIDLIKYYLGRPDERHVLAEAQRNHFLQHHTYDIRMQEMLNKI